MSLRFKASSRTLLQHPWHLLLTILGVALGVAITVALDLAIESSREAFRVSTETVTGRSTHQVLGGPTGLPDTLPAILRVEGGLREVAPVLEGWAVHTDDQGRPLRLLGIDPLAEAAFRPFLAGGPAADADGTLLMARAGSVFLGRELADRLQVDTGDPLPLVVAGRSATLSVVGVLAPEDDWSRQGLRDLLVVDVSEAQELLDEEGRLHRIDLILPDDGGPELEARIEALLPPGARLEPAGARDATMAQMTRAFDLNLTALSLLGLVFGVFLIYNTMTFSVVRRRRLLGTLRALGVTRSQVVRGILLEALVLGVAGAVLGVLLGTVLGRGLVQLVTRTINDLYFVVSVEGLDLPVAVLLRGGLLGVAAAVLASLPPAREAAGVSPREALTRSTVESRVRRLVPVAAVAGGLLLALGGILLGFTERSLGAAFAGLFAILLGMALVVPAASVAILRLLRPVLRRGIGILGAMAARGVETSLSRTAPALAALVIAVSVTVGLGVMIQSFRGSVVQWLDVTLQADVYVSPPGTVSARAEGRLPAGLDRQARELEGVRGVSTYRGTEFLTQWGMTRLVALGLDPAGESGLDLLGRIGPPGEVLEAFRDGEVLLVSEPMAFRHGIEPGDTLRIPGDVGTLALPVGAVFRDFGSDMSTIMVGRVAYDRHWDDPDLTSLGLFLEGGVHPDTIAEALRALAGGESPLQVRSNLELRELTMEVFDRTFEVTRVLRLLAFLVAFVGVLSALMALQLERVRELGVLRANGMTPRQTWGLVTAQTGLMGLVAGLLALPAGLLLAWVMIHVVNRRSFGWTLELDAGGALLWQSLVLALLGALLAGIYPSWRMSRTSPAEALREE
ncbi:MAG: ABC transporter permease [Gemmatimonadales bacterium]|nr:MAG: ABC transporter permease [Gemmatimonadales bacterium]